MIDLRTFAINKSNQMNYYSKRLSKTEFFLNLVNVFHLKRLNDAWSDLSTISKACNLFNFEGKKHPFAQFDFSLEGSKWTSRNWHWKRAWIITKISPTACKSESLSVLQEEVIDFNLSSTREPFCKINHSKDAKINHQGDFRPIIALQNSNQSMMLFYLISETVKSNRDAHVNVGASPKKSVLIGERTPLKKWNFAFRA